MNQETKKGRIKLLLVGDEAAYVNVLANRMARRHIEVTKALSGTEGIQALRKEDFDVAILDLKMEDMDGIEVWGGFPFVLSVSIHATATVSTPALQIIRTSETVPGPALHPSERRSRSPRESPRPS